MLWYNSVFELTISFLWLLIELDLLMLINCCFHILELSNAVITIIIMIFLFFELAQKSVKSRLAFLILTLAIRCDRLYIL